MDRCESQIEIAAECADVMEVFWRPERWPAVAAHVRRIDCLYGDEHAQVLVFSVRTGSSVDVFKSVRIRHGDRILFYQPVPPAFLRVHSGRWTFEAHGPGTIVRVLHRVVVDPERARERLQDLAASDEAITSRVMETINANSLQTMRALKTCLETERESAYVASTR
ncbi:MAG: SRPBCC family protein [Vicinamibacterales bacterium]